MSVEALTPKPARAETIAYEGPLTLADAPWLEPLRDGLPIDDSWLDKANQLLEVGSIDLGKRDNSEDVYEEGMKARDTFYGELLDWANPESTYHELYTVYGERVNPGIARISTFIGSQRVLYMAGLNGAKIIQDEHNTLGLKPALLQSKIDNLYDQGVRPQSIQTNPNLLSLAMDSNNKKIVNIVAQGFKLADAKDMINKQPTLLNLAPETFAARMRTLAIAIQVLGWEGGSAVDLVKQRPQILSFSAKKLRVHVRLLMRYGQPDMPGTTITQHFVQPLEAHVISLHQEGTFVPGSVRRIKDTMKGPARKQKASELLAEDRPRLVAVMGEKALASYEAYTTKSKKPRRKQAA